MSALATLSSSPSALTSWPQVSFASSASFTLTIYWFVLNAGIIIRRWSKEDKFMDQLNPVRFEDGQSFDFIVVGAGSAGALVSNRLVRSGHTVLLLEAGGTPHHFHSMPALASFLMSNPETNWMHKTVPQKHAALNSIKRRAIIPTGKGLGGSGNLNFMIHLRGHRKDFDNWANLTGDPSWSWEGVLPHFKSYEDYEIPGDPVNHGYGGDLRIEAPDHIGLAREFVAAGGEMGYPQVDLNAPFEEGFDIIRYPIKFGRRQAPFKGFIEPVRNHPRMTILKYAHVNRILFRNGNEAYGVQFDRHGKTYTAVASKEIILSAGTLGSPKILMLSGIGPRGHLEKLGIPIVKDLPVGRNLQDHLRVALSPFLLDKPVSTLFNRDITAMEFIQWTSSGKGRLSSTAMEAAALITSDLAKSRGEGEMDWPDIQLIAGAFGLAPKLPEVAAKAFSQNLDELKRYYDPVMNRDGFHVVVSAARPFSRGYLKLGGSSPYDKPIIDTNYLGDPGNVDFQVLMEGVKKSLKLVENSTALGQNLGAKFTSISLPGCEHLEFRSDSYWECFIRRNSMTLYHPVGTVAMGKVVDTDLKLKGVNGLRVVDGSVQPTLVTTNTQASILMIAEKASAMILNEWSKFNQNIVK